MRKIVTCYIPIELPTVPNENGIYFTEEAIANINFENIPLIHNEIIIGVLTNEYVAKNNGYAMEYNVKANLWLDCEPELMNVQFKDGVMEKFNFSAISI